MRQRIMPLCALAFIVSVWSLPCHGQDIEPRRWRHLPIGGNFAGGVTAVDGVSSDNFQSNLGWGFSLGLPITRAVGVKFAYIGTRTQVGTGLDSDTFAAALSVAW